MPAVHRHGDARVCLATTIVSGQSTVYANGRLVSVNGDINTHGAGALIAGSNNVFAEGKAVVNNTPDAALIDTLGHAPALTKTAAGSSDVNVGD